MTRDDGVFKEAKRRKEDYSKSDGISNSCQILMIQRETNFSLPLGNRW